MSQRANKQNLEIPLGKRTVKYRILEILPGVLSYTIVIMLFILSLLNPAVASIYLLVIITMTLVKAIAVAYRTVQGYQIVKRAEEVNWKERLGELENPHDNFERLRDENQKSYNFFEHIQNLKTMTVAQDLKLTDKDGNKIEFPNPREIYHAVLMVAYNESLETLIPTVEAVRDTSFENKRIIFVLGYEERGGEEMEKNALELKRRFKNVFYDFILVKHPADLKDEIQGKGPNLTYAGEFLQKYTKKKQINSKNVIVTSLDSDNRMSKSYLDYVAYEFVVHPNRQKLSYQPVSLFMNNIWDVPAMMRIIAISNSFFNVINSMRPHALRNFASHSQPLWALEQMNFWSKRTIVEDGHQFWRSLFFFKGDYEVLSIKVPIYQDAVMEDTLWKTLKAQFVQLRRWDYGASDVAYVGVRLFSKERQMPFLSLFAKFVRLLDGHVTLAAMAPIIAFGGWVPRLLNFQSRELLTYNLPSTVSWIQMIASVGIMITIIVSLIMLPPRPVGYSSKRTLMMVLQWVLMPVVAIIYQSFTAFYSQTRLLTGNYMEKFDVTKKIIKK